MSYSAVVGASRFDFAKREQHPTGLTMYYPNKSVYDNSYAQLAFVTASPAWAEFIKSYHFLI